MQHQNPEAMTQILTAFPGIRKIWYADCKKLPTLLMPRSMAGELPFIAASFIPVKFHGNALLETECLTDANGKSTTATITFNSLADIPLNRRLAFLVQTAGGEYRLVGTRERRYPVVSYTESSGTPDGEAACRTYKITHKDIDSAFRVLV